MKTLLIIWYSRTGASESLALVCAEAATRELAQAESLKERTPGSIAAIANDEQKAFNVALHRCDKVSLDCLLSAQVFVFICPENLGSMAGAMKEFFDGHYYPALGKLNGRSYACMVAAGSDGDGAVRQIERIAVGWRLKKVTPSVIISTRAQTSEAILARKNLNVSQLKSAQDLGQMLAAGLMLGLY